MSLLRRDFLKALSALPWTGIPSLKEDCGPIIDIPHSRAFWGGLSRRTKIELCRVYLETNTLLSRFIQEKKESYARIGSLSSLHCLQEKILKEIFVAGEVYVHFFDQWDNRPPQVLPAEFCYPALKKDGICLVAYEISFKGGVAELLPLPCSPGDGLFCLMALNGFVSKDGVTRKDSFLNRIARDSILAPGCLASIAEMERAWDEVVSRYLRSEPVEDEIQMFRRIWSVVIEHIPPSQREIA